MMNYKNSQSKNINEIISEYSSSGQVVIDSNNQIIYTNIATNKMFQILDSNVNGMRFGNAFNCCSTNENKIVCGQNERCKKCRIKNLNSHSCSFSIEYKYKYKNSYYCKWLDFHVKTIFHMNKKIAILTINDVTKYITQNIKLKNKLEIDLATGALNKFSLMTKINTLIKDQNAKNFTACIIDFDDFKFINDTYGHLTGDSVLEKFAIISKNNIRSVDLFGRFGGEEFVFIFIDTPPSQAMDILRRIYKDFNNFLNKDINRPLTLSCGLSYVDKDKVKYNIATELIGHIDKLLYKAKQTGKNKIVTESEEYFL